jgi:hypothetical protein
MSKSYAKSLAMRKMEKNFIAHIDKGYQRRPYSHKEYDMHFWLQRLYEELNELEQAKTSDEICDELADLSNIIDFIFEKFQ